MSNPYQAIVQQKLVHCRFLLDLARSHGNERQGREALLQGAVLHLCIAYRQFLRELACYLQHPSPDQVYTLDQLAKLPLAKGVVNELHANQWLSELTALEQQLLAPAGLGEHPVNTLIASDTQPKSVHASISETHIRVWWKSMSQLVETKRAGFEES